MSTNETKKKINYDEELKQFDKMDILTLWLILKK